MVRCLTLGVILLFWLASDATAGAWLREKGTAFVSLSGELSEPDEVGVLRQYFSLYGEYGWSEDLTLGVDVGHDMLATSKAIAFVRLPLVRGMQEVVMAAEIGAGAVEGDAALRPGLSIGRGLRMWNRNGWLSADGRAVLAEGGALSLESDLTFGLSVSGHGKIILQIQTGQPDAGDAYAKFAPSFVYEMGPGAHLEIGVTQPLTGSDLRSLSLGLWRTF